VFGLSDFFFTFTCNPKWPEIVNNFYSAEQRPSDKLDVIVRVYHMKLQDIKSRKMFRPCRAGTIIFKLYFLSSSQNFSLHCMLIDFFLLVFLFLVQHITHTQIYILLNFKNAVCRMATLSSGYLRTNARVYRLLYQRV
jgi:hypothetical protein